MLAGCVEQCVAAGMKVVSLLSYTALDPCIGQAFTYEMQQQRVNQAYPNATWVGMEKKQLGPAHWCLNGVLVLAMPRCTSRTPLPCVPVFLRPCTQNRADRCHQGRDV